MERRKTGGREKLLSVSPTRQQWTGLGRAKPDLELPSGP